MSRFNLSFCGIRQAGASDELVYKGRRRMVAYFAFIVFVLIVAALSDEAWVSGGLEYTFDNLSDLKSCEACGGFAPGLKAAEAAVAAGAHDLGATFTNTFQVGLDKMSINSEYDYRFSGARASRDCIYDLQPYLNEINAAATSNNSSPFNIWYGLAPLSSTPFNAAKGLLGFAAFLQLAAWLLLVFVQYEMPYVSRQKVTLWVVRGLLVAAVFFTLVGVAQFGAAPIKNEFCKAFDPDGESGVTGMPCGFGDGLKIAIAAIIVGAFDAILAFAFMSLDLPQAYAFSGKAGYEPTPGTGGASTHLTTASYNGGDAEAPPVSSNAYQTIGTDS